MLLHSLARRPAPHDTDSERFYVLSVVIAVSCVLAGCHVMPRSILCNSTNNPFGGAGSSGDIGAGNGMGMRNTGKGVLSLAPSHAQQLYSCWLMLWPR